MKPTPQKQKKKNDDKNRFRFQSFNERVAEITIGVARRFDEIQELDEDADTFFHQGLEKWRELNCTAHFTDACRDLPRTRSLPQVIHHQADIVAALKKHLVVSNSLALPPLLDLVLQLARDLHSGFYVYFEDFFNVFVTLLNTNNPECIEQVYTTLAYLVKFLWHCLLKHINTVFKYYRALLSDTQKPYITAFAAESFAYLVRKLRKPAKFIAHVAGSLEGDEYCQGVGLLFFESVKGVLMQFHSSTETLLSTCLPQLGHPSCPNGNEDMVLEVLLRCMQEMAEYTRQEHCAFIWPLLLNYVESTLQEYVKAAALPSDGDGSSTASVLWAHMERVLRLVQKWITWRWGTRMDNAPAVYKSIASILRLAAPASESHAVRGVVIDLVHYARPFDPAQAKPIVDKVLSASSCRQALEFAHHLAALGGKGLQVLSDLPGIVEGYAAAEENHADLLIFLSSLSQRYQDRRSSADEQIVLDLSVLPHTARMLSTNCQLPAGGLDDSSLDVGSQRTWSAANAFRICRSMPAGLDIASSLSSWLSLLCRHIGKLASSTENLAQNEAANASLNSTTFAIRGLSGALMSLQGAGNFLQEFSLPWVLNLLRILPSDIHVLMAALSVLDAITDAQSPDSTGAGDVQPLDTEGLAQAFAVLQPNLSHPLQPVRLATLQILSRFPQPMMPSADEEGGSVPCPVIQYCLEAQEVQPSLQEFREKLRLLDQLKCIAGRQEAYPDMYKEVALRYLLGSLYVNFQPIWTPVAELITSYTTNANRKMFWNVFSEHLTVCTSRCRDLADSESMLSTGDSGAGEAAGLAQSLSAVFCHTASRMSVSGEDDRVDHLNFRMQLWRTMALFPSSSEASTRFVVPIFLSYVREEYSCQDDAVLKHQDLRHPDQRNSNSASSQRGPSADLMAVEGEDESASEEQQAKASQEGAKKNRRMLFKTLSTMLSLFSKFIDPRSAHKAAEMKQLMLQFLCHRDEEIQSLALQYLMAYKPAFLLPYRENLFNLLKETGFRDYLTHFSIDEESGVVKSIHRTELIPYLIRILYGCMLRGTGASTAGKQGIRLRHGVVLRFLSGCPSEEVKLFMDLVAAPFQALMQDVDVSAPLPALDISHIVPLRKQQGFLTMVGQVFSHLRSVIPALLSSVLRVILCITSWVGKLLKMCRAQAASKVPPEELLDTRILSLLRTLRQLALARLTEMFDLFPQWDFEVHMKHILEVAVWPQLGALPAECLQHPTPLMKLLLGWSQRSRFLGYFSAPTPEGMNSCMLHYVFACLQSAAVRPPVVQAIMQMVENLLNNGDEQKDADALEPSAKRRKVETSAQSTASVHTDVSHERGNMAASADGLAVAQRTGTAGENLLLPHLHMILEHLGSLVISNSAPGKHSAAKKANHGGKVPLQYLATLSRMSEFVESPSLSEKLIKAFLPLASKSLIHGDALSNVLLTISRLMQRVPDVDQFIVPLSRLLATVKVRSARQHLCSSLKVIGASCQQFEKVADIVQELNSWDPKRLEEPDFERRLDAFTTSAEFLASSSEPRLVLVLLHSALYTIHHSEDIALRDCACHLLHKLIQKLAVVLEGADEEIWNKQILGAVLLPALQQGVRSKSETVRHEFVALLSEAVRSLSGVCPRLANLQPLHTEDLEMDFFENVRHIQMHRRTNAFRFLATQLEDGLVPATTTASFVLPLANSYLDTPGSDHNLITQVVAVLAALAKQSPWARYKSLLQRFLRLLVKGSDQQKIYIRVVVSILESFHFDVKSVDPALFAETNPMIIVPAANPQAKASIAQQSEKKPATEQADAAVSEEKKDSEEEVAPEAVDRDDGALDDAAVDAAIEAEVAQDAAQSSHVDMEDEAVLLQRKNTLARRIFTSLRCDIIPELDTILSRKVAGGASGNHNLSSHENDNADLIISMPVALAVVKLFQKLPEEIMHAHLPGLLLKVCNVLRSRSKDVRDTAKQSLVKISCSLGPRYLSWVLKELRAALSRGYQLHILGHALHSVLDAMVETIAAGEVDDSVVSAMQVVSEDLFGEVAAEREVGKIADKVPEARSSRSRLIVQLLAQVVSGEEVRSILNPMREVLKTTQSLKVVHCVEECLRHISLGLLANTGLQAPSLLVMVHGACKDNNSGLGMVSGKNTNSTFMPEVAEAKRPTRPELYSEQLLSKAPVRGAKAPGMSKVTNMHIMIEFSLQLLLSCFKRSSINTTDKEILQMLDPLCRLLASFLGTQHVKLLSISLRCLVHLLPLPLPALQSQVGGVVKHLFKVLKEYSVAGAALGNNHEMIVAATKAMTTIVRSYKKHKITDHQLELLMTYVEEDIHDFSRKGTAFPLLKAILSRKFEAPVIHDVMTKVLELLVMADVATVQLNCRQAMMQYLLDYALGKKVQRHVNFLVKHLEFRVESGRESVLEMLNLIFTKFPAAAITDNAGLFFVTIAPRVINDDSVLCRKLASLAIKSLLEKVDDKEKNSLFSIVLLWLDDKLLPIQRLGYQIAGVFVGLEGALFERRLVHFLPLLLKTLTSRGGDDDDDVDADAEGTASDHVIFTALTCLTKIIAKSQLLSAEKHRDSMNSLWDAVEGLLLHPHDWVRLYCCRLFGFLFAHWPADKLLASSAQAAGSSAGRKRKHAGVETVYLRSDAVTTISLLARRFLSQLSVDNVNEELSLQVIKNLVYVAKVLRLQDAETAPASAAADGTGTGAGDKSSAVEGDEEDEDDEEEDAEAAEDPKKPVDLTWLVRKMVRISKYEAGHNQRQSTKRTCVLRWLAALTQILHQHGGLDVHLATMLSPVLSLMHDKTKLAGADLYTLAETVLQEMRTKAGHEVFTAASMQAERGIREKRDKRRQQRLLQNVANPELAAQLKIKLNSAKKEAKKRKQKEERKTAKTLQRRKRYNKK